MAEPLEAEVVDLAGIVNADEIVDNAECRGQLSLPIHTV